jgi:hypothetical protein
MASCVVEVKASAAEAHTYIETLDDTKFLSNTAFPEGGKIKFMIVSKT